MQINQDVCNPYVIITAMILISIAYVYVTYSKRHDKEEFECMLGAVAPIAVCFIFNIWYMFFR